MMQIAGLIIATVLVIATVYYLNKISELPKNI
jgi:hypothetical protein